MRIGHPLYGEIRRDRAGPLRLRRLRGRVASELAKRVHRDDTETLRLGVLWLDSDLVPEPTLLFDAAHAAFLRFDLGLAERLAGASARAGGPADAALLCAQALALLNRPEESQDALAALRAEALDNHRAYAFALKGANLWTQLDRPEAAWKLVDTALHSQNAVMRQAGLALRGTQLAMSGRPAEALATSAQVSPDELGDFLSLIAAWALVIALGDTGRLAELAPIAIQGYERARHLPDSAYMGVGLAEYHVKALALAGSIDEALAGAQAVQRQCADAPGTIDAVGAAIAAIAALATGRLDLARHELSTAAATMATGDAASGVYYRFAIVETEALARLGDSAAAATALERVQFRAQRSFAFLETDSLLARAWADAARGAVSQAIAHARRAAQLAHGRGQLAREVMSLQTATHFGDTTTAARLGELRDLVEGPRAGAAFDFAAALAAADGAALRAASSGFEKIGDMLAAADASAHAAIAYRGQGLRGAALTAAGRAQRLARECGGAVSPALREAAQPLPLTPREREIISLVAQGLSNRQIADAMCVSVRTVEGHLYRASVRSGATNRAELWDLLREYQT
ncbi:helix-turn-helix transcriptional regulator [Mycobacterium sp. ENV421]|uniref:helix-turn-helix transcriptional regulator n=1 Tax=Mycobacterium sp. ENV421 TaxID=1213407 RepID=UPI002570654A|nr:helix-turn-helix transcriptional regulator [Mycobacterium sp. ENV421]